MYFKVFKYVYLTKCKKYVYLRGRYRQTNAKGIRFFKHIFFVYDKGKADAEAKIKDPKEPFHILFGCE